MKPEYIIHKLYNQRTLKMIYDFAMANEHKPLPTKIWKRIYMDIAFTAPISIQAFIANLSEGHFYIIEGARSAEEIVKLPISEIMKFPRELQDIIFEARKRGDYNKTITFRGVAEVGGTVHMWQIYRLGNK